MMRRGCGCTRRRGRWTGSGDERRRRTRPVGASGCCCCASPCRGRRRLLQEGAAAAGGDDGRRRRRQSSLVVEGGTRVVASSAPSAASCASAACSGSSEGAVAHGAGWMCCDGDDGVGRAEEERAKAKKTGDTRARTFLRQFYQAYQRGTTSSTAATLHTALLPTIALLGTRI